jgi:hypothetical protein
MNECGTLKAGELSMKFREDERETVEVVQADVVS